MQHAYGSDRGCKGVVRFEKRFIRCRVGFQVLRFRVHGFGISELQSLMVLALGMELRRIL